MAGFRGVLWCNLGRTLKFGPFDARLLIVLLPALFHIRIWTLSLVFITVIVLTLISRAGYTIPNILRRARVFLSGKRKRALTTRKVRSDI